MARPKGSVNKKIGEDSIGEDTRQSIVQQTSETIKEVKKVLEKPTKEYTEKIDRLKKLMNEANRKAGKTVLKFACDEAELDRISFGVDVIDQLTGGGIPHKRFSILWGPKSAGKTTLCYRIIAQAQKQNKICGLIDMERTFDPKWAVKQGVDLSKLILINTFPTAESAMDSFLDLVKGLAVDLVILDSVQALSPKGEQETKKGVSKSLEDDTMALLARKLSQFFRISSGSVYEGNVAVLLVGQARMDLGGFIAFESLSGGHALQHWSSMTINIKRGAKADSPTKKVVVDGKKIDEITGFSCNIKLEKRKVDSKVEGSSVQLPFYFDNGFKNE